MRSIKKLSIIVPIYNAEKYVKNCIESIIAEIDDECELILINDGSRDKSLTICEEYKSNKLVKIYNNENHGVSYTRNFGIQESVGEYIMFVDADDFMVSGWYDKIKNEIYLADNNMFFFERDILNDKEYDKKYIIDNILKLNNELRWAPTTWSKIYSKQLLVENKINFKEDIMNGEDMLFNIECVMCSCKIKFIQSSIYNYRINPFSVTKTFKSQLFEQDRKFLFYLKELGKKYDINIDIHYSRFLENAIIMFCNKLSLIKNTERQEYIGILKEEPYNSYIKNTNIFLNKKNEWIINLLRKEKYTMVVMIMKLNNIIKNINKKESIIKI